MNAASESQMPSRFGALGESERVMVDGEHGTAVDSPFDGSYIVRLDSGDTVQRMRATIQRTSE